jgi:hypothetical protein
VLINHELDTLDKTKITGIEQVDTLQNDVNNLVGNQFGKGGLLQPVGDAVSKEGVNRAERGGKASISTSSPLECTSDVTQDEKGQYGLGAASSVTDPMVKNAQAAGEGVTSGAQGIGSSLTSGAKSAGGYVGSFFGGGKGEEKK